MGVLTIILGVLLAIGGVACMVTPFATFLAAGYIICIALFIFGIFGLINAIRNKSGALSYVASILAIVVGIIAIVNPGGALAIDTIILVLVAVFFLVSGVISIINAIQIKKENSRWWVGLIAGILGVFVGIICIISPFAEVFALGILIGFFLISAGVELIAIGAENR